MDILELLLPKTKKALQNAPKNALQKKTGREALAEVLGPAGQYIFGSDRQKEAAQAGLELGSWAVPFGKGKNIISKFALPGLFSGAVRGASEAQDFIKDPTSALLKIGMGAAGGGAGAGIMGGAGKLATSAINFITKPLVNKATQGLMKATPTMFQNAVDSGIDLNTIAKKYIPSGVGYDDLVGAIAEKGRGGILKSRIQDAEKIIQATAKTAGSNIRISGDELIKALKAEARTIGKELGGEGREKAIKEIIKQASDKYKKGISVKGALELLRKANARFGESVLDTEGDAVAKAAQKLEANTMRSTLKTMFPDLASALDEQGDLLTLRPVLNRARSIANTQGSDLRRGSFVGLSDLVNPISYVDAATNTPKIASSLMKLNADGNPGALTNVASKGMGQLGAILGLSNKQINPNAINNEQSANYGTSNNQESQNINSQLNHTASIPQQPSNLPKDGEISPQGQWRFDAKVGDWVPNKTPQGATGTQGMMSEQQIGLAMLADLAQTGGKNIPELATIAQFLIPKEEEKKTPSATSLQVKGKATAALSALDEVERMLEQDPNIPLFASLPGAPGARQYEAAISSITDAIGGLRTGATVSKEQQAFYRNLLPKLGDSLETRRQKLKALRSELGVYLSGSADLQDPLPAQFPGL